MLVNLMMQNYLYGRFRWPWISELYEFVQGVYLLPALVSVILNPSKPTFKVTAKNESLDKARLSELARPFYIIFFVLLAGVFMTVWRIYAEPYKADVALVVGGWNLLNILIAGCALGVISERQENRQSRRIDVRRRCELVIGDRVVPGTVEDASVGGARLNINGLTPKDVERGMTASLRFKTSVEIPTRDLPITVRTIAPGSKGVILGCRYEPTVADHYRLISDLIFSSSDQWSKFQWNRRVNIGILRGTIWFVGLSVYQTGRGLGYLIQSAAPRAWRHGRGGEAGSMRSAASSLALLAALLMVALPAAAQAPQPFNMGSEQGDLPAQPDVFAPSQPSAPMPQGYVAPLQIQPSGEVAQPMPPMPNAAQTPRFTVPTMVPSIRGPASAGGVDVPSIPITPVAPPAAASAIQVAPAAGAASTPAAAAAPEVSTAATATPAGGELVRYIIPQRTLRLAGENDQRSWSVFLTANEAAQQAELSVAYKNAIVVMPEASRLRVVINNAVVLETPLSSSDDFKTVSMALPAGLLRAGGNVLRMQAFQRHRTDCSVQSTYELWTDIDPTKTQISFEGGGTTSLLQSLQDLPAVGYGPDGITRIHIVAPATAQGAAIENVLKLSQAIGVLGAYPNPDVQVLDRPAGRGRAGNTDRIARHGRRHQPADLGADHGRRDAAGRQLPAGARDRRQCPRHHRRQLGPGRRGGRGDRGAGGPPGQHAAQHTQHRRVAVA